MSTTINDTDTTLAEVESQAQQVVCTIKACIDEIRSIKAFHPITVKTAMSGKGPTGVARPRTIKGLEDNIESVYMFRILEEKGLLKQVQDICYDSSPEVDDKLVTANDTTDTSHPLDADRRRFIYKICLPLLNALSSLYKILDEAATSPPSRTSQEESESKNSQSDGTSSGTRIRKKPDAPRGLLSLSNYTDIACLLELTVCTSFLPLLERHVQTPIKDRVIHLPKSLAGRLHRKSLRWGAETLQLQPTITGGTVAMRQNRAAVKIDRAAKELSDATVAVCKVLLLDRFRPMLLPRHATDVYSALFQLERLIALRNVFAIDVLHCYSLGHSAELTAVRSVFLHSADEKEESKVKSLNLGLQCMDFNTMVMSYQALLASGKHAPVWLKLKISNLLTGLATSSLEGLKAIIDVFVVAASSLPTEQMTGASSRLGRVLCARSVSTGDDGALEYYNNMFDQLMDLLVFKEYSFTDENSATDNSVVASVLTTWAILDNLPKELVRMFFRRIIDGLLPSSTGESVTCNSLKLSVRRIHSLLLFPPNSGKSVDEFCLCLLSDVEVEVITKGLGAPGCVSAMGQLIRIATAEGDQVLHSDIITETKNTINMIAYAALLKWNFGNGDRISSEQYLAVSLMRAIINNPIDMLGYHFQRSGDEISLQKVDDFSSSSLLLDMERRAIFLVTNIIVRRDVSDQGNRDGSTAPDSNAKLFRRMESLASSFFKLQLLVYFQASSSGENASLPNSIVQYIEEFKIMSMMILPLLCEKCSPGTLLAENDDSSSREVMYIMRLVITGTSGYFGEGEDNKLSGQVDPKHGINFVHHDDIATPFSSTLVVTTTPTAKDISAKPDIEAQLSIVSIVLSILVTILELGSSKRIDEEETELRLLVPHLSMLSILSDRPSSPGGSVNDVATVLQTEIAEMASHALALIQARSLKELPRDDIIRPDMTLHEYLSSQLKEIETNLASDQPPLRAYAVSKLRKLARGTIERLKVSEDSPSVIKPLIVEMKEEDNSSSLLYLANAMLRVCISTLDDKESYVYLASIQTIVSMVDQLPKHFMPVIMHGVTSGNMNLSEDGNTVTEKSIALSTTQRVKLVEAMNFIIRRRGPAIQNYSISLMNSILHGKTKIGNTAIIQDSQTQGMIQSQTEKYFRGTASASLDCPDFNEENRREDNIRLMTGGPIFDTEEIDIIRSACISMLTELLSVLHPSSAAPYCVTLVQFATNALVLDHSRLVRRASALLGRELYVCALRELQESNGMNPLVSSTDYILALLSSGEDALLTALRRAIKSDDVDLEAHSILLPAVGGKTRLYDSATVARCEEAIACRRELEEDGIIQAAAVILKAQKDHDKSSIAALISREIGGATRGIKFDLSK